MRDVALLTLTWGDQYGRSSRSMQERTNDQHRVRDILAHMGFGDMFEPSRESYPLELEVGSEPFKILVQDLQPRPDLLGAVVKVERSYNKKDLETSELLVWRPINQAIEDDYYALYPNRVAKTELEEVGPLYRRCPICGVPLKQVRDLVLNKTLMGKRHLSHTYSFEMVISSHMAQVLKDYGLTGFELRTTRHYKKGYKNEPALYQLVPDSSLPPMSSPPTEFESVQRCPDCHRTTQFIRRTYYWGMIEYRQEGAIYYPEAVLKEAKDFNYTSEWIGERRVAHPYVVITQRVYRLLREHELRGWTAEPVRKLS